MIEIHCDRCNKKIKNEYYTVNIHQHETNAQYRTTMTGYDYATASSVSYSKEDILSQLNLTRLYCKECIDKIETFINTDVLTGMTTDVKKKLYLYAARDTETGKLLSDLTNPRRKYWDREYNARAAIDSANSSPWFRGRHEHVELVKFELVEVPVNGN